MVSQAGCLPAASKCFPRQRGRRRSEQLLLTTKGTAGCTQGPATPPTLPPGGSSANSLGSTALSHPAQRSHQQLNGSDLFFKLKSAGNAMQMMPHIGAEKETEDRMGYNGTKEGLRIRSGCTRVGPTSAHLDSHRSTQPHPAAQHSGRGERPPSAHRQASLLAQQSGGRRTNGDYAANVCPLRAGNQPNCLGCCPALWQGSRATTCMT